MSEHYVPKETRRSGLSLIVVGLLGIGFFFATDPKWGVVESADSPNVIDARNQGVAGTRVGIAGGGVVTLIGLWLMTRRTA